VRRLELDFLRIAPAARRAGWLLLAAAAIFALDLGRAYHEARASIAHREVRLARAAAAAPAARLPEASPGDLAAARETIRRLGTPWGRLFAALESAPTDGVALLSVTPDPRDASVLITGEAHDYGALLRYVEALRRAPPLAHAYLVRHESQRGAGRARLAFSVRAPWGPAP